MPEPLSSLLTWKNQEGFTLEDIGLSMREIEDLAEWIERDRVSWWRRWRRK